MLRIQHPLFELHVFVEQAAGIIQCVLAREFDRCCGVDVIVVTVATGSNPAQ